MYVVKCKQPLVISSKQINRYGNRVHRMFSECGT